MKQELTLLTREGHSLDPLVSRRRAIQWVMGAVAAASMPGCAREPAGSTTGATQQPPPEHASQQPSNIGQGQEDASRLAATTKPATGYGTDPNLVAFHKPGDIWPLTLTEPQKRATTALADVIFPKDDLGPAASELGVTAMIDEWVSAPYPIQKADREIIVPGLDWIDAEAGRRFGKVFADLDEKQKTAICDDICDPAKAARPLKDAARFFTKFRGVAAGAYYATPEGWKAIGYEGNVALGKFDGPPPEVLQKLDVTQTVA